MTALQPFSDEQLNFFKFSSLVLNEFPKALRQTFKIMWDNTYGHRPGFQLWDDSTAVRNMFDSEEAKSGKKTKVPVLQSYNEWDCTSLFQATIFAWSFASTVSTGPFATLSDLYVKPCAVPYGSFHACVVSPGGNKTETIALAIDQLRLLRNSLCHSTSSEMDKATFDQRVNYAKDAFQALGVSAAPIDALGSLTESDFPTNEVRKLEKSIKVETREYILFLEEMSSDVIEIKALLNALIESTADKEDIAMLEQKIARLHSIMHDEPDTQMRTTGVRRSLSIPSLPGMVPNFTGRQSECEEIMGHLTSESTRLVSIWGSPGFGKTSVAIAVGHALQSQGLPVYWVSLRGLQSKADLTSKLLSFVTPSVLNDQPSFSQLSLDDQLCLLLSEISDQFVFILDNADDLLEDGAPGVKKEVLGLLKEILRRSKAITFAVTTRESLDFLNVDFEGHQSVRIGPLDEVSATRLVKTVLPAAKSSDCTRILQICGLVPFAIKLMCSSISEDNAQPSQYLDQFMKSASSTSIAEMLDRPDYPDEYRLQSFFELSFKRQRLLVSKAFGEACWGAEGSTVQLLSEASPSSDSMADHSLGDFNAALDSFQHALDIHRKLFGEQHASTANSYHSLGVAQRSLGDFKAALDSSQQALDIHLKMFGEDHADTADSYDSLGAIQQSLGDFHAALYCTQHALDIRLRVFGEEHTSIGKSFENLSDIQVSLNDFSAALDSQQRALNIYLKLFGEEDESTVNSCDTLGAIHLSLGDYKSALNSIQRSLDIRLKLFGEEHANTANSYYCLGVTQFSLGDYKSAFDSHQHALDIRLQLLGEIHASTAESYCRLGGTQHSLGDKKFALNAIQRSLDIRLKLFGEEHESTADSYYCLGVTQHSLGDYKLALDSQQRALNIYVKLFGEKHADTADSYDKLGVIQHSLGDYKSALDSKQHAFDIRLKRLFGEEHPSTADSYDSLAVTQHSLCDYKSALNSQQRALNIRLKLFREDHASTAASYYGIGITQHSIGDLKSALYSHQRALDTRLKLFGEEHESTGDSYHNLGVTQHSLSDLKSALDSNQRALDIRLKLFGEEHTSTALSYYSIGVTQHSLGDYKSALVSQQNALNIRLKLFGEEHASTADSYYGLGFIQESLGDIKSAQESYLRSSHIRFKLGEEQKEF